ncbi:uncharacterized protein LOC130173074 [Seriola aureovittata]|uniref:uncharacterized protein LOC130173074 n=1 Tax=Seriola aureovittata TaxID=2871759 RepID=UPI0024BDE81A|nr:uncharacterized protein LOC130173074 [Seriola aureovittata]
MWCYQKPGFEAHLLAELQRQQQCSQFCDTLLKAEGVSVPAHSCVLSAISPHVSSALSSTPAPPAGQSHLLEFRALGACTLLHMVRLLYSGEMAGEGETEKQEAISAAAKLGIHGLVEVKKSDHKSRNEGGGGQLTEVGVQTEPLMLEQNEGRRGKWRREVRDGSTFLWKDTLSDGEKDMWTQTEELEVNTAPPTHSAASFETTDLTALQGLGQTDSHFVPPQIPYVPISLVYPPEQNQTPQPSSFPAASMQDTTTAAHTSVTVLAPPYTPVLPSILPFSTETALCDAGPHSWWTGPQGAARDVVEGEEWEGKQLEQFQGNIPGFINYFLNADKEEGPRRGRPRRRRGAGVGDARRAGTGERRARRPRARTAGRGRGRLMQTVDVQDVGVSRLQKLFLQRSGMRTSRTGQGGGAAGRKLYLRAREHLKPTRRYQRRGRCGKEWEVSQSGDILPYSVGGGGDTQQFKQDSVPVGRAQRARAKSTASVSFPCPPPPMRFYNIHTLSSPSPSIQPSPSPIMLSTAAPYVLPATSLLHTTTLPSPAPPPHQDQPEQIDRLLEEVMMGLDILPNNNNSTPHSQPPLPASSSSCTYTSSGKNLTQSKLGCTTGLLEAGPGVQGSSQVVAVGASSSTFGEVPDLQQQGEGELNDMLNHFLQSFERHINSCSAREEEGKDGETPTEAIKSNTVRNNYKKNKIWTVAADSTRLQNTLVHRPVMRSQTAELQQSDEAEKQPSRSQPSKASARTPKHAEGEPTKRQSKRRKNQYLFSLERKRVKKPVSTSDAKIKILHDREDKQLKQMPVVKLERRVPLPVRVKLQEHSCQSLEIMDPAKVKTSSSSVKYPGGTLSQKNQPVLWSTKTYPIRSRFREAHIMDTLPFLEGQLAEKRPPSAGQPRSRPGRPKKNGQLLSLSNGGSSTPTIQLQPVEHCGTNGQLEKNQELHEEELNVQPQEEAQGPTRRGKKRGESGEETSDDATVAKRVCCEPVAQPTSETCIPSSKSAGFASEQATVEADDVIDVETVSLTSEGDFLQRKEQEDRSTVWREIILRETGESLIDEETEGGLEIIDVDGDTYERADQEKHTDDCRGQTERDHCQSRTAPTLSHFVSPPPNPTKEISERSRGSWEDEDIDVIGGSSPVPDPEVISWAESSEGEEGEGDEDVDVVGEKTGYASSVVFATMIKGELVNQKYKTEVL